jgi:hypothetical protein
VWRPPPPVTLSERWLDMAQQWTKWAELEQKNEDQKE